MHDVPRTSLTPPAVAGQLERGVRQAAKKPNPGWPARGSWLLSKRHLRVGQGVFDKGIVQWANDDGPGQQSRPDKRHVDCVSEDGSGGAVAHDFEPVRAFEPQRGDELEGDLLPWFVGYDWIADSSVAPSGTKSKRLVQAHSRPMLYWPQRVLRWRQRVKQPRRPLWTGAKPAFVYVEYAH